MSATKKPSLATRNKQAQLAFEAVQAAGPTMAQRVELYRREHLAHKARGTQRNQHSLLVAMESLGPHPSTSEIKTFVLERLASGRWGEMSVRAFLAVGSTVCGYARNAWPVVVCPDPFAAVTRPEERLGAPKCLADPASTFPELLERACRDDLERAFLSVQFDMGLRVGEALGLYRRHEWEGRRYEGHVLLSAQVPVLYVQQQRSPGDRCARPLKTKYSNAALELPKRTLHLLKRAALRRVPEAAPRGRGRPRGAEVAERFLFPFTSRDLYGRDGQGLFDRMRQVAPDAFPEGAMAHVLRHTFAEALLEYGAKLEDVSAALRHGHVSSTQAYCRRSRGRTQNQPMLNGALAAREAAEHAAAEARREGNLALLNRVPR